MEKTIKRLTYLLETMSPKLEKIKEEVWEYRAPNKWSKKEIIGHLLDSTCNNHQRFLKAQFEALPFPIQPYNQDKLVILNDYQYTPTKELIDFWRRYNNHILRVIKKIPGEKLENTCSIPGQDVLVTLRFLIQDYVAHMEHHLEQVLEEKLE